MDKLGSTMKTTFLNLSYDIQLKARRFRERISVAPVKGVMEAVLDVTLTETRVSRGPVSCGLEGGVRI